MQNQSRENWKLRTTMQNNVVRHDNEVMISIIYEPT